MRLLLLVLITLVLAAPAVAARGPESPPGASKARVVVKHYTYRQTWYASDGTPIRVVCRVGARVGCRIVSIG